MAAKVRRSGGSPLVTVESFVAPEGERRVTPRILGIERALQRTLRSGDLVPVLLLRGTVADDGTHGSWTVKTFARTDHRERRVVVTLEVVSESLGGLPRSEPFDRPLTVTVRPDPRGSEDFADAPYEVLVQSSERTTLARAELVLSNAA